jgi:hypothetical protein
MADETYPSGFKHLTANARIGFNPGIFRYRGI